MADGEDSALAQAVAGALAWWRDAGVDLCFDDAPARWISPAQPTAIEAERLRHELREAPPAIPAAAAAGTGEAKSASARPRPDAIDLGTFPADPALFAPWWLAEPSLDDGRTGGRVPPRGEPGAAVMVIVAEPEADDSDRLLAGPQGRLLAAILAALRLTQDAVYVASVLPRHMPIPDWEDLEQRGYGALLARHVTLMAPQRIVAFGSGVLSLLSHSLPNTAARPGVFAHGEIRIPLFSARSLEALIARPVWKAELWKGLLEWLPPALDRASLD